MVIEFFWIEFSSSIQWGLGQWCLNTDLLKDLNHVNYIKYNWEQFWEYRKEFENAKGWADAANGEITYCFLFNTEKTSRKRAKNVLTKEKENIENLLEINYCESKVKELDTVKKRINDIEDKKVEEHRIRARIPNFEETEANITYYTRLEKSNQKQFNLFFV